MWDNYRLLNILANCLFTLVVLAAAAVISPSVINLPVFALKEVNIIGMVYSRTNPDELIPCLEVDFTIFVHIHPYQHLISIFLKMNTMHMQLIV